MLEQAPEEAEASLIQYYHRDYVADAWLGEITPRQLGVLLSQLPDDSAFKREVSGAGGWTDLHFLLWNVHRELQMSRYEFAIANSDGKLKLKMPEPLPYPGMAEPDDMPEFTAHDAHDLISAQIIK